ncbi:unnamed protein product [Brassica oleracea var. botrytis]
MKPCRPISSLIMLLEHHYPGFLRTGFLKIKKQFFIFL